MIAALLAIFCLLADLPCHCAAIVETANGYRCAQVRARSACPDVSGWHLVAGAPYCSSACGDPALDDNSLAVRQ